MISPLQAADLWQVLQPHGVRPEHAQPPPGQQGRCQAEGGGEWAVGEGCPPWVWGLEGLAGEQCMGNDLAREERDVG